MSARGARAGSAVAILATISLFLGALPAGAQHRDGGLTGRLYRQAQPCDSTCQARPGTVLVFKGAIASGLEGRSVYIAYKRPGATTWRPLKPRSDWSDSARGLFSSTERNYDVAADGRWRLEVTVGGAALGRWRIRARTRMYGHFASDSVRSRIRVADEPPIVTNDEGFRHVRESGPAVGGRGTLYRYSLQVERGTGVDVRRFTKVAERKLNDKRGWRRSSRIRLQRVPPRSADIRVVLAKPSTVDRYCARIGLRTGGIYSCWDGRRAMINLTRWNEGAAGFNAPLWAYRSYVLNHEVGHGLGYGHRTCPGAGRLAPVMMQQTKGTYPCRANAWPYPHAG